MLSATNQVRVRVIRLVFVYHILFDALPADGGVDQSQRHWLARGSQIASRHSEVGQLLAKVPARAEHESREKEMRKNSLSDESTTRVILSQHP